MSAEPVLPSTKYRVNQFDALYLDSEIVKVIREWIEGALSHIDVLEWSPFPI